jgi:hypothetical protein
VKLAQVKVREREDALIAELKKTIKVEIDEGALKTVKVPAATTLSGDAGP